MQYMTKELFRLLFFMQMRFLQRYHVREAKIAMLTNAWNKFLGVLLVKNVKVRSNRMSKIIQGIGAIDRTIIREVLEEYLRSCQKVHTIAFFQWRIQYPSHLEYNEEILEELVQERIEYTYQRLIEHGKATPEYALGQPTWHFEKEQLEKFESVFPLAQNYQISSFEQIGMFDPFPKEESEMPFTVPTTKDEQVYHRDNRNDYGNSPKTIFFPSRRILFKLMRASIGV